MRREASIPLFLWAASAILAHILWSGGADQGAKLIEERLDIGRFASDIRSHVKGSIAPPLEIAIDDDSPPDEAKPEEQKPDEDVKDDDVKDDDAAPDLIKDEPKPKPKPEQKPKPEEKKPEPVPPAPTAEPPKPAPQVELPKKIAVQQHVEDEKQKDNPDAAYISDTANHVQEETRARITSTDQNDKKPTPGAAPSGPKDDPGNAEETHVRQDMDQPGLRAVAPGGTHSA